MKKIFSLVAAGMIGGFLALSVFTFFGPDQGIAATDSPTSGKLVNQTPTFGDIPSNFRDAAAVSMPAVVHISAREIESATAQEG